MLMLEQLNKFLLILGFAFCLLVFFFFVCLFEFVVLGLLVVVLCSSSSLLFIYSHRVGKGRQEGVHQKLFPLLVSCVRFRF